MPHSFTIANFLLIWSVSLVVGDCPADSYRHKTVNLGIFYTDKFFDQWISQGGSASNKQAVLPYLKKLASELTDLFSTKHFGKNSVTFTVNQENVMQIPSQQVTQYMIGELRHSALAFCKNKAHPIREQRKQTWDINFVFLTESEKNGAPASGVVAQMQSYCSPNKVNCGIMTISAHSGNVETFGIYPKLFAHEIGHSLGLPHDSDCHEEPCDRNGKTIMNSPGSKGAYWSDWSKRLIDRLFQDKKTYTCLKWKCGVYKLETNNIFSNKADLEVLNKYCYDGYDSPQYPFKVDDMMTDESYTNFIKFYRKKSSAYYNVWKNNPQWYKYENICGGYPCKAITSRGSIATYAWTAGELEGEPCGKDKVCKARHCVAK